MSSVFNNISALGKIEIKSTDVATGASDGALTVDGGVSVAGAIYGDSLNTNTIRNIEGSTMMIDTSGEQDELHIATENAQKLVLGRQEKTIDIGGGSSIINIKGSIINEIIDINATEEFSNDANHPYFGRILYLTGVGTTITLPSSTDANGDPNGNGVFMNGKIITIINGDTEQKTINVVTGAFDTIDGQTTISLPNRYDRVTIMFVGNSKRWYII